MESTNKTLTFEDLLEEDAKLTVGQRVKVYWGYGLGFHAEGRGVITKLFSKSVRVRLTEDAYVGAYCPDKNKEDDFPVDWPAGYELRSIPRILNDSWQWWQDRHGVCEVRNGVKLIEED